MRCLFPVPFANTVYVWICRLLLLSVWLPQLIYFCVNLCTVLLTVMELFMIVLPAESSVMYWGFVSTCVWPYTASGWGVSAASRDKLSADGRLYRCGWCVLYMGCWCFIHAIKPSPTRRIYWVLCMWPRIARCAQKAERRSRCIIAVGSFLWSPYVIGQTIIFLPCSFFLLSFFFFLA